MILFRRKYPDLTWEVTTDAYACDRDYEYRYFNSEREAAVNCTPTPTLTLGEYTKFVIDYDSADNKYYRFGQAFINECLPNYVLDPDLFHTTNRRLAETWILERYVSK